MKGASSRRSNSLWRNPLSRALCSGSPYVSHRLTACTSAASAAASSSTSSGASSCPSSPFQYSSTSGLSVHRRTTTHTQRSACSDCSARTKPSGSLGSPSVASTTTAAAPVAAIWGAAPSSRLWMVTTASVSGVEPDGPLASAASKSCSDEGGPAAGRPPLPPPAPSSDRNCRPPRGGFSRWMSSRARRALASRACASTVSRSSSHRVAATLR
mmetsp:Transcript_33626/g.87205  ORF Transcript_33626/g.87205 Transcript_33626/m.87205 type:complete len:213 (-) Transcript_33626:563-1201(-)